MGEVKYPGDPVTAFLIALHHSDVDAMRRFAQAEPDLSRKLQGRPLPVVCEAGKRSSPEAVRVLIELGAPINEQDSNGYTGLTWAVDYGRYEVAKALLECGADPNLKCPIFGVTHEDVEDPVAMAQLLLDHGADINGLFFSDFYPPRTVLSRAIDEGRTELADFLRSRGAKLPSALPAGRQRDPSTPATPTGDYTPDVLAHFAKHYGKPSEKAVRHIVPVSPVPVGVHYIRPSWRRRYAWLFTLGLSQFEMTVPQGAEQYRRAELLVALPKTWPPPQEALKEDRWAWPIQWLLKIAAYPVEHDTWLGGPWTVLSNEEPPEPLGPGTKFSAWVLASPDNKKSVVHCKDGTKIQLYSLYPLYPDEYLFEREHGAQALVAKMAKYGLPEYIDVDRVNVIRGR